MDPLDIHWSHVAEPDGSEVDGHPVMGGCCDSVARYVEGAPLYVVEGGFDQLEVNLRDYGLLVTLGTLVPVEPLGVLGQIVRGVPVLDGVHIDAGTLHVMYRDAAVHREAQLPLAGGRDGIAEGDVTGVHLDVEHLGGRQVSH